MNHQYDPLPFDGMPDSFHPSMQDLHTLEETDFIEIGNGPPAHFDEENLVVIQRDTRSLRAPIESTHVIVPVIEQSRTRDEVQFITSPSAKSYFEVAIARSIIGNKQVSLLSERENGEHQRYAVKVKSLHVPGEHTMPLIESIEPNHKQGEPGQVPLNVPLALEAALAVYDALVNKEFPAAVLRNGKSVPTHISLLRPTK